MYEYDTLLYKINKFQRKEKEIKRIHAYMYVFISGPYFSKLFLQTKWQETEGRIGCFDVCGLILQNPTQCPKVLDLFLKGINKKKIDKLSTI